MHEQIPVMDKVQLSDDVNETLFILPVENSLLLVYVNQDPIFVATDRLSIILPEMITLQVNVSAKDYFKALYILTPVTVVVDIVTFPVQFLFALGTAD